MQAMDPIVLEPQKCVMYAGQARVTVPIVFRMPARRRNGALRRSIPQGIEAWFCRVPRLQVVAPGTPCDAKGLLGPQSRNNTPVFVFRAQTGVSYNGKCRRKNIPFRLEKQT